MKTITVILVSALLSYGCNGNSSPDVLRAQCDSIQGFSRQVGFDSEAVTRQVAATQSVEEVGVLDGNRGEAAANILAAELNRRIATISEAEFRESLQRLEPCLAEARRQVQTREQESRRAAEESQRASVAQAEAAQAEKIRRNEVTLREFRRTRNWVMPTGYAAPNSVHCGDIATGRVLVMSPGFDCIRNGYVRVP